MKNYIIKKKIPLLFTLIFLTIFILGQLYSNYMVKQITVHEEENITFEITGFDYNFDTDTMARYPYLVHVTLQDDSTTTLYLSIGKAISGVESGVDVSNSDIVAIQEAVSSADMGFDSNTHAIYYAESTRTLTVITAGFHSNIQVDLVFNADFTSVSYDPSTIVSSESYAASAGVSVPTVETYYLDGLVAGNTQLDAYAGASVGTSPAMQSIVDFISAFMAAQAGGGSNE